MLPKEYEWLESEKAPALLVQALKLYGVSETPGEPSNKEILSWAQEVGFSKLSFKYVSDEVPWCGLFLTICAFRASLEIPGNPLRALSWSSFGKPVPSPMLGDVLVFTRKGGGHVGIYVGEDKDCFHVLGGNQSDKVCITRIQKVRLYSASRTNWKIAQPNNVRKVWLSSTGTISQNEQ